MVLNPTSWAVSNEEVAMSGTLPWYLGIAVVNVVKYGII